MPLRILNVAPQSPASLAGIRPGDMLSSINGENINDDIDYQALTSSGDLHLIILRNRKDSIPVVIRKNEWQPLGLTLEDAIADHPYVCQNHCMFCFMDQMPNGLRPSLYIKDDDWRMSFRSGSYITLNNINDVEFDRLLRRKPSPLYISVHATDPDIRCLMMGNKNAGTIMKRLKKLCACGIHFHCQVVLCPGVNDGKVLERTIHDCAEMYPNAISLAVVPVGLTKYRSSLARLSACTPKYSDSLISKIESIQSELLRSIGTRFVFAADEFYCISCHPVPNSEDYENYPQYGNGIGMLRRLEEEFEEAELLYGNDLDVSVGTDKSNVIHSSLYNKLKSLTIATGVSAAPWLNRIVSHYSDPDIRVTILPVRNRFFGDNVTVTGLITGRDIADSIRNCTDDAVCISNVMLRSGEDVFLDGMTLNDLRRESHVPIIVTDGSGSTLYRLIKGMEPDKL